METTDIARRLGEVKSSLPQGVRLVAVSKLHPSECIKAVYDAGQRLFGESRERELARKVDELPNDIEWHFIGHLQTNKVKYIAPYISMIDAVDSLKLLREIISTINTIAIAMTAWNKSEYSFKKSILR